MKTIKELEHFPMFGAEGRVCNDEICEAKSVIITKDLRESVIEDIKEWIKELNNILSMIKSMHSRELMFDAMFKKEAYELLIKKWMEKFNIVNEDLI